MSWFCTHDWQIGQTDHVPSAFEKMGELAKRITKIDSTESMFRETFIYHYKCARCGQVRVNVVRS